MSINSTKRFTSHPQHKLHASGICITDNMLLSCVTCDIVFQTTTLNAHISCRKTGKANISCVNYKLASLLLINTIN